MVHTLPDYTTRYKMATVFGQIDNSELAARLWSPSVWDRRGNLVWQDDFEHSLNKWNTLANGAGASATISANAAHTGDSSCKLVGGDSGESTNINKWIQTMPKGRIGIEFSFNMGEETDEIRTTLTYFDGTHANSAYFSLDKTNRKILIQIGAITYVDVVTDLSWQINDTCFYTVKIVMDLDTNKYVRLIHRDQTVDLSAYPIYEWVSASSGCGYVEIAHKPNDANNAVAYIDNVIITQNEP